MEKNSNNTKHPKTSAPEICPARPAAKNVSNEAISAQSLPPISKFGYAPVTHVTAETPLTGSSSRPFAVDTPIRTSVAYDHFAAQSSPRQNWLRLFWSLVGLLCALLSLVFGERAALIGLVGLTFSWVGLHHAKDSRNACYYIALVGITLSSLALLWFLLARLGLVSFTGLFSV